MFKFWNFDRQIRKLDLVLTKLGVTLDMDNPHQHKQAQVNRSRVLFFTDLLKLL